MFYVKNIPVWERVLRIIMGVAGLGYAAMHWGTAGIVVGAAIMGAVLAITGLFGFCPMCAMAGRKLDTTP